jgi:hypothetical protein
MVFWRTQARETAPASTSFPRISHILKDLAELKRICIAYLWFSKELSCIKQRILACAPRFPRKYDMVPRIYGFLKGLLRASACLAAAGSRCS